MLIQAKASISKWDPAVVGRIKGMELLRDQDDILPNIKNDTEVGWLLGGSEIAFSAWATLLSKARG